MSNQEASVDKLVGLFESKYALFVAVARRHAPAPDLVYDIVQQAFLDFLRGLQEKNWDLTEDVTPLIVRFVKDRALLSWREKRRAAPEVIEAIGQRFLTLQNARKEKDMAETMTDEIQAMKACVGELPSQSRNFIQLFYTEGWTAEQIAERQKIKPDAVRQRLCRIRAALRKCIKCRLQKEE